MKIELVRGCTCDFLGIDGKKECDLTDEEKKKFFSEITEKLPELDPMWFRWFLLWIVEEYGELSFPDGGKPCECCGDIVEKCELTI